MLVCYFLGNGKVHLHNKSGGKSRKVPTNEWLRASTALEKVVDS